MLGEYELDASRSQVRCVTDRVTATSLKQVQQRSTAFAATFVDVVPAMQMH